MENMRSRPISELSKRPPLQKNRVPLSPSSNSANSHAQPRAAVHSTANIVLPKRGTGEQYITIAERPPTSHKPYMAKKNSCDMTTIAQKSPSNSNNTTVIQVKPPPYRNSAATSPRSNGTALNKYASELSAILSHYPKDVLNYPEVCEVLRTFYNNEPEGESNYYTELWHLLSNDAKGVPKKLLSQFILSIVSTVRLQPKAEDLSDSNIEDDSLNEKGLKRLTKKFSQRLTSSRLSYRRTSNPNLSFCPANFSFAPKINSNSGHLASKARGKLLNKLSDLSVPQRQNTSTPDLLLLHKVVSQKNIEEAKKRKESMECSGCTFHPRTNSRAHSRMDSGDLSSIKNSHAFPKSQKRIDRKPDECVYERDKAHYTFKPFVNKKKAAINISSIKIKGEKKSVDRTIRGRLERERVTTMLSRGYSPSLLKAQHKISPKPMMTKEEKLQAKIKSFLTNRKYSARPSPEISMEFNPNEVFNPPLASPVSPFSIPTEEKTSPAICIELNIGEGICEKIMIHEEKGIDEVIEAVCTKYGLVEEAKEKLKAVIIQRIQEAEWGDM